MSFKPNIYIKIIAAIGASPALFVVPAYSAELTAEPSISFRGQYDDNVRKLPDENNPVSSTAYKVEPRIKFAANEQGLWDMSVNARGRLIRYQDIEDSDSDNVFFDFNAGRKTELTEWRLITSFEQNSNFDTDYDTETPDAGLLLDDRTESETVSIAPSFRWSFSEMSQMSLKLSNTNVTYDEVISETYKDYETNKANAVMYWLVSQNHRLGFTSVFTEYDSPDSNFSYEQIVFQIDYTYNINQTSNISLSLGERRIDSTVSNAVIACQNPGELEFFGECLLSPEILGEVSNSDDGVVSNLSYSSVTEFSSHSFNAGRTVVPSSFGSAQENRSVTYKYEINNTERFTTSLLLDASKTETVSGISSENDRTRYRFEPSVIYKLTSDWSLSFKYSYLEQSITSSNLDSASNSIYINLHLHWPKLATTY